MSEQTTAGWEKFLKAAVHIRGNPLFDLHERDRKLEVARSVRELISKAQRGERLLEDVDALISLLCDPRSPLIWPVHTPWLKQWARTDEPSLRQAIAGFSTNGGDAFSRFARFAGTVQGAVGAAPVEGKPVMLFGSLFNFALEPLALPIVRQVPFWSLERRLGQDRGVEAPPPERYANHVAFARWLESRLRDAGLDIRDMLDVQGLIIRSFELLLDPAIEHDTPKGAALEERLWAPAPPDARASAARATSQEPESGDMPYLSISACLGYERPYLIEWIEFHRLVGVERFFLYNNRDRDTHREMLAPYVEEGIVVLHEWPLFPPQIAAASHCVEHHRYDSRWIGFIDTDEFLFSPTALTVPEVLVDYEGWPGVGVNWVRFGPSGHRTKPPGLVIESYLRWTAQAHRKQVKTIADPRRALHPAGPHMFVYDRGHAVDENHYPISADSTAYLSISRLRLNHYYSRSEEEFSAKEETKHPSIGGPREPTDFDRILREEEQCGRMETAILRYLPDLRAALGR